MRTTLDLPEDMLEKARRAANLRTKRERVIAGLEELLRKSKREELLALALRAALLAPLLLAFSGISLAGANTWTTNGPFGGPIGSIVVDPSRPLTLYAAAYGVFKSMDAGSNWKRTGLELGTSYVRVLEIDPSNPQILYAGADEGVFKSVDGGQTWTSRNSGLANLPVVSLLIDPRNSTTLYVGTTAGNPGGSLFKTVNGALTWHPITNGIPNSQPWSLTIDPSDSAVLYAVVGAEVFRSVDGGGSWTVALTVFPFGDRALAVEVDVTDPAIVYAATTRCIYRSLNRGGTWQEPAAAGPVAVGLLSTPGCLYASDFGGLFKSTDHAVTWTLLESSGLPTPPFVRALAIDPQVASTLYASALAGVFKSTNAGLTWTAVNRGINAVIVAAMAITATPKPLVLAGTAHGVYRSSNEGASWEASSTGIPYFVYIASLGFHPAAVNPLYAGSIGCCGIYKSADGGSLWDRVFPLGWVNSIVVDPKQPTTVYAGDGFTGVYRTVDGGATWASVSVGLPIKRTFFTALDTDPERTDTLYLATAALSPLEPHVGGIFKSVNRGDSWSPVNSGLSGRDFWFLTIDPSDPKTIYAGTRAALFRTKNGGHLWRPIGTGLPDSMSSLALDPIKKSILYLGAGRQGVYRSTDGGETWLPFGVGLGQAEVYRVETDQTGRSLYAATSRGVFQYESVATSFHTLIPCRVVDTRETAGPALTNSSERSFALAGWCGIPATARSVALNVTVTQADSTGFLTLYETGTATPDTFSIAYRAGQTRANNAIVALDPLGRLTVKCNQPSGSVHVILDVSGYFE